jgi:hypothetical protein
MSVHSLLSFQLNTARVVAILTPHLTARAACILSRFIMSLSIYEESRAEGLPSRNTAAILPFIQSNSYHSKPLPQIKTLVRIAASR